MTIWSFKLNILPIGWTMWSPKCKIVAQTSLSGVILMSQVMSAREANSLRIRAALVTACGDLLVDKPIDAVTINNIVEKAGVAKGSFYNHFPDKESLALSVSAAIRAEVERKITDSNRNVTD